MIIKSPIVSDRRDFGAFANLHGVQIAVEVGVDQGNFTAAFLHQWRGSKMYLIDPYLNGQSFEHDREWDLSCVRHQLGKNMARCRFIRGLSTTAHEKIRPKDLTNLGFVYIDADHSYRAVKEDLKVWWPLVKSGGIFAGHDFNWEGVRQAVSEFFEGQRLDVYHTHEPENVGPSWYVLKP